MKKELYKYLKNGQTCFLTNLTPEREHFKNVSLARRVKLCQKFGYTCQWEEDENWGSINGSRRNQLGSGRKCLGIVSFVNILLLVGKKRG